jgi:UDP-2-acetamido-3-amino-2,3-dideoxy-glucuronate N-acetyltransferase
VKAGFYQHPRALVESTTIGAGTRVWAFAHVMPGARIGRDCNIGDHAFIETGARIGRGVTIKNGVMVWDGVVVGDYAFLGPQATFTNDLRPRSPRLALATGRYRTRRWLARTYIGRGATIGANATVVCGVRIGAFAMVGAGTVVTGNVPAHALWLGVPGRLAGYVCECGEPLQLVDDDAGCRRCRARYVRRGRTIRRRT